MVKKLTIDDLAGMIKHSFDATATKGDLRALDQKVDTGFQHVNARLAMREELHDLRRRVEQLEQKAGLLTMKSLR